MTTAEQQTSSAVRPFRVEVPDEALDDLRRRLTATRWPTPELVAEQRLHQLIRQPPPVTDRLFEIEFPTPDVQAVVFTFG